MSLVYEQTFLVLEKHGLSLRFRSILNRAYEIACANKSPLNAEPLMLAILQESDCDVVEALRSLGVTTHSFQVALDQVRDKMPATAKGRRVKERR